MRITICEGEERREEGWGMEKGRGERREERGERREGIEKRNELEITFEYSRSSRRYLIGSVEGGLVEAFPSSLR